MRVLLASMCIGVTILLFFRGVNSSPRHFAGALAWGALTFTMWYYIVANIETWWFQSSLMQTFGLIVWIPSTVAVGAYLYVLWVSR